VLHVARAKLLRAVVVIDVVLAVRQAEAALPGSGDHLRAVLQILFGAKLKDGVHVVAMQMRDFSLEASYALDRRDALEFRFQRLEACRLHLRFIHAACEEVADLLPV